MKHLKRKIMYDYICGMTILSEDFDEKYVLSVYRKKEKAISPFGIFFNKNILTFRKMDEESCLNFFNPWLRYDFIKSTKLGIEEFSEKLSISSLTSNEILIFTYFLEGLKAKNLSENNPCECSKEEFDFIVDNISNMFCKHKDGNF